MAYGGPPRGGTRGGAGLFKWTDVAGDKDRENYLGHSLNAPVGRWQKNKDITWYNKDNQHDDAAAAEMAALKAKEEEALALALGYKPTEKSKEDDPEARERKMAEKAEKRALRRIEKEERRADRESRRAERREERSERREHRVERRDSRREERRERRRDSHSPPYRPSTLRTHSPQPIYRPPSDSPPPRRYDDDR